MKFRGHETFFIRKGWLYKGIKNVDADKTIFYAKNTESTDVLGIGTNMVKALKYWLLSTNLIEESREKNHKPCQLTTNFGRIVMQYDKYFEEEGTLWYLHYNLVTNKDNSTSWYWLFNKFDVSEFNKNDFIEGINSYILFENESEISKNSLEDDFNCIINTYISNKESTSKKYDPEDKKECPLSDLGLLEFANKKNGLIRKVTLKKNIIDPYILMATIIDANKDIDEIKISTLLSRASNIGVVFNMDINVLNDYLDELQNLDLIKVIRTAGLDIIKIKTNLKSEELLEKYYQNLS